MNRTICYVRNAALIFMRRSGSDNNLIDPSTWDGNEIDDDGVDYDDHPSTKIIAEGDENGYRVHLELRGHAGRKEFCE